MISGSRFPLPGPTSSSVTWTRRTRSLRLSCQCRSLSLSASALLCVNLNFKFLRKQDWHSRTRRALPSHGVQRLNILDNNLKPTAGKLRHWLCATIP